jgi:cardiolipin synthase
MTFVYWKGRPAQQFADALCDRAKAGLRVRVLIDALGGIQIEDGIVEAMEDSGVDVHWYRKLWLNSPFKQNHRGHRKVCIIDETIGFTGGVGIAEEWGGDARNEKEWRDTHFRVEGPAVDGLAAAFIQDWAETGRPLYDERDRFPDQPQPGTAAIQVVRGSAVLLTRPAPGRRAQGCCQPRSRRGHPAARPERGQTRCATSQRGHLRRLDLRRDTDMELPAIDAAHKNHGY